MRSGRVSVPHFCLFYSGKNCVVISHRTCNIYSSTETKSKSKNVIKELQRLRSSFMLSACYLVYSYCRTIPVNWNILPVPPCFFWEQRLGELGGVWVVQCVFPVAALVYQQQLLFRNKRDFPCEDNNVTNLFLHAGAGEDTTLLPQAGGDHLGHDGGVGCVFNLQGHTEHADGESKTG